MPVRNRTIKGSVASEHVVQFFDTDESRAQNVAAFLAQGYAAGEPVMVIARPLNWTAIASELETCGISIQQAIDNGRIVVKDADDTLRRLSRGGVPDRKLFTEIVGQAVTRLSRHGRVRAYGEMVNILAQEGEFELAVQLEGYWNELSEHAPILLLCGYSAAHFVAPATRRMLLEVCRSHSGIHHDVQDPLGNWLLTSAHSTSATHDSLRH